MDIRLDKLKAGNQTGVPIVTFSFWLILRVRFGSWVSLIPTLCEIGRIAVLKSHDTDLYSSRTRTYPDVPCSKTCDVFTECQELYSFQFRLKIRRQDTSLKRGVWRPGNFLILSDLPQIMAYRIRARGQSNCVFLSCLSKNCLFHRENSFTKYSCPEILRYQTNRSVFQNPIFHGNTRIAQYSRTRNSTVLDESVCILEAGFPRYYENSLIFKDPKFLGI